MQSGWEKTPHKKRRKKVRGVPIEWRLIPQKGDRRMFTDPYEWSRWGWYKDLPTAEQALDALRKSHKYGKIISHEFRIPDEYRED